MKEQVLATPDELVIRDLYPMLVSNKRLYLVGGDKNYKKVYSKKIIELDKITAIRYMIGKIKVLLTLAILFLVFGLLSGGAMAAIYFAKNDLFTQLWLPLTICTGALLATAIILFIIYACKTKIYLYIEYPTNLDNRPTRITLKSVKAKDFQLFITSLFQAIDAQGQNRGFTPPKGPSLIL